MLAGLTELSGSHRLQNRGGGGPERPSLLWPEDGGKMPGQLGDVDSPSSPKLPPPPSSFPPAYPACCTPSNNTGSSWEGIQQGPM